MFLIKIPVKISSSVVYEHTKFRLLLNQSTAIVLNFFLRMLFLDMISVWDYNEPLQRIRQLITVFRKDSCNLALFIVNK